MRTVLFRVKSIIGTCYVEVDDDKLNEEEAIKKALQKIEDNGVDEPSRGIRFYYNDEATENEHEYWDIHEE